MIALVAVDGQLLKTQDGRVWTKTLYGYEFWKRYLSVFDEIHVVSRMKDATESEVLGFLESSGERVSFKPLPMAIGMKEYLKQWRKFSRAAKKAVEGEICAVVRVPSVSNVFIEREVKKAGIPYVVEVIVDPENAYEENIGARILFSHLLKKSVQRANGVSYVTQYALQEKYPAYSRTHPDDNTHFETYYSSIVLKPEYFYRNRNYVNHQKRYKIIHTANNFGNYVKGHKEVILTLKRLRDDGYDVSVEFIGDGPKREEFEEFAKNNGVANHVVFTGLLSSGSAVREHLINADLFLFPSKAEGLPRAIIEAMAVGLPCISTPVNGIPELLEPEFLFAPSDVTGFATKVEELIDNPNKMNEVSARNLEKAKEYTEEILTIRRNEFYKRLIKQVT